jgi:hypothetical protein
VNVETDVLAKYVEKQLEGVMERDRTGASHGDG